jgi:hypothetical protein
MDAAGQLREMVNGYQVAQALHVAAALGVSDLLADRPRTVADLAAAAGADPDALGRLLHALAKVGVYAHDDESCYRNTELAPLCAPTPPVRSRAGRARSAGRTTGRPGPVSYTACGPVRTHSPRCTAPRSGSTGPSTPTSRTSSTTP